MKTGKERLLEDIVNELKKKALENNIPAREQK